MLPNENAEDVCDENKMMICNATAKDQMSHVQKAVSAQVEKNSRLFRVTVDGVNRIDTTFCIFIMQTGVK